MATTQNNISALQKIERCWEISRLFMLLSFHVQLPTHEQKLLVIAYKLVSLFSMQSVYRQGQFIFNAKCVYTGSVYFQCKVCIHKVVSI